MYLFYYTLFLVIFHTFFLFGRLFPFLSKKSVLYFEEIANKGSKNFFLRLKFIQRGNTFFMDIKELSEKLKKDFAYSYDFITVEGKIGEKDALYFYLDGMIDKQLLEYSVIRALKEWKGDSFTAEEIGKATFSSATVSEVEDYDKCKAQAVLGFVCFYLEEKYFSIALQSFQKRTIAEPPTSSVLKGPREGFTEDLVTNTALLRKRLKTPDLVITKKVVGRYTQTGVCICYISSVADKKVVDQITERIDKIDIDGIIDSSYIAQLLEDKGSPLFSRVSSQEKPDIVVAKMLEGRVAIVVEGSPMVLTVPYILWESLQDSQDYYKHSIRVTVTRVLRLFGLTLAVILPAFFVAVQEHQYQMLPLKFTITIINATTGTPLTPTLEMLFVLLIFDMLNEASVRMPKYVGMALSIVGAIVLGETAVNAGLLSSPAVLVTAMSAIGLYTAPDSMGPFSIIRLALLGISAIFGVYGLILGIVVFLGYLVSIKGFGADFTAPFSPLIFADLKDGFVKRGIRKQVERPYSIPNKNRKRIDDGE